MNILKTAAHRSTVVHAVDGRPGVSLHQTMCGTRIGDEWAGEYTAEPEGDVSCRRCLPLLAVEIAEDDARLAAAAEYSIGERVGIVTGVQSVNGPTVTAYGTVTAHRSPWGTVEYLVKTDDGEELLYRGYLLRKTAPLTGTDFITGEAVTVDLVSTDTLMGLLTGNPWNAPLTVADGGSVELTGAQQRDRSRSMAAHPVGKGRPRDVRSLPLPAVPSVDRYPGVPQDDGTRTGIVKSGGSLFFRLF